MNETLEPDAKNAAPEKAASMKPMGDDPAKSEELDDQGTDQAEAAQILTDIRDTLFNSNDAELAVALGRPVEEVAGWIDGSEPVDGDVLMKARALADERGMEAD